ncbi:protocadherin fat [Plakobranchus ocellatus]|uniref:Protocadherin fat n=1 Tax=Plakobranchus ocellatus TaxID=259542 RepID=A0AAV3YM23_9GAST|nr:protocadherin fat [Plakobranchus ocellatus]
MVHNAAEIDFVPLFCFVLKSGGNPARLALTTLPVQVSETVLAPPRFLQDQFRVEWSENRSPGFLMQLEADDSDTDNDKLRYTINGSPSPPGAENKIQIFPNGSVYITELFDAEQISYLTADLRVTDGNSEDVAQLVLNITDVNDNDPVLNVTGASVFNVPENAKPGTLVVIVGATDIDITNSGFTFWLGAGGQGKFDMDQSTGVIMTSDLLDRRVASDYNLTVHASDFGSPPRIVQVTFSVVVEDSNTGPVFLDHLGGQTSEFQFNVPEDLKVGEFLGSLRAFDPDTGSSGELSYSIVSGDPSRTFSIDSSTGNLSLASPLNYEETPGYSLTATVSDRSYVPAHDTAAINIRVINVVEAPRWPLPLPVLYLTQTSTCSPRLRAFSRELTSVSSQGDETVEYRLVNGSGEFWINATSGLLHTNQTLEVRQYVLNLLACSSGTDVCAGAELVVVVRSDDILAFCPAFYRIEMNESSPVNQTVTDLVTNKPHSDLLFQITGGNEEGRFSIDPQVGRLFVDALLDRETTDQYTLIVTAIQRNSPTETAQAQITIAITDSPDNPPLLLAAVYQGQVSEADNPGAPVHILGTSLDLLPSLSLTALTILVLTCPSAQITIAITDSPDNPPLLSAAVYQGQVSEADNPGAPVHILGTSLDLLLPVTDADENPQGGIVPRTIESIPASDADQIDNGRLEYNLLLDQPSGTSSPFSVDSRTGMLWLERELDRESVGSYIINITVADSDFLHQVTQTLYIAVTDANDNSPKFENMTYFLSVVEGAEGLGTELVLQANDADIGANAELVYTLGDSSDAPVSSFNLSKTERGVILYTVKSMDREATSLDASDAFTLVVIATDGGEPRKSGSCSVIVTVEDVNDNRPTLHLAGQALYQGAVQENAANNTVVVINPPVVVTDADKGENGVPGIHFWLQPGADANETDTSNIPFTVDDTSGQIMVRYVTGGQTLDRESRDNYQLNLVAADQFGQGLNTTAQLIIKITDVDDVAPRFTAESSKNLSVAENAGLGTEVGTVRAVDGDQIASVVVYSLQGSPLFTIHHFNGDIRVAGSLDREAEPEHILTVSACDLNGCDHVNITVHVTDVNDNCPVWNTTTLTFNVVEDQGSGLRLGDLQAKDPDLGLFGTVEFYLNDTTARRYIDVSPAGTVTLKAHVDDSDLPAQQDFLSFPVYAQDKGVPPCVTRAEIRLVVTGVNDNPPEICFKGACGVSEIKLSVLDKSEADTVIGQVESRDIDSGSDGHVMFSFASDLAGVADLFNISSAGIITLARKINLGDLRQNGQLGSDDNDTLRVLLVATDKGSNSRSSNTTLLVTIVSSQTDAPVFTQFTFELEIAENSIAGALVGTVKATSPRGSQLTYSLSHDGNSEPFTVEPLTVIVHVTDINDNRPTFAQSYLSVSVLEGDITDPVLATLQAQDADLGDNGTIQYQLINNQFPDVFFVNATSGELRLLQPLDRESVSQFDLVVQASDGGGLTDDVRINVQVEDANDNSPIFMQSPYRTVVIRSNQVRQTVIQVQAMDVDAGANGQIVYTLDSSTDPQVFTMDYLTGEIDTIAPLPADSYRLVVIASDQGNPPRITNVSVIITVENNNTDVIATVALSTSHVSLFVGMGQGTQLLVNVTTENAASLEFSAGNEGGWFELTPSGHIILKRNLISDAVFDLTLTATSVSGYKASKQLQVAALHLTFEQPDYIVRVTENGDAPASLLDINSYAESLGTAVVYWLSEPSDYFALDAVSGTLTLLQSLDRETNSIYELQVSLRLLDGFEGAPTATASVVVSVRDQNDNVPSFGSLGPVLIVDMPENVTSPRTLATLTAFDADEGLNGFIAYQITSGDTRSFSLDRASGELQLADATYFNSRDSSLSRLTVTATDRNGTGQSAALDVEIRVSRQINQFVLLAPIPVSTFEANQNSILSGLSGILGWRLVVDDVLVHSDSSGLDTSSKISENQAEISKVFQAYMEVTRSRSQSDDDISAAAIALIVIGCIMFVVSLAAIAIVVRLWKRQKAYAAREETAARARQRVEERIARQQASKAAKTSRRESDDPDQDFEM